MASEYLKWKYRDVQPDEPLVLSNKERFVNWWHYHKWLVLLGALLLGLGVYLIANALGFGKTSPDVQFAFVGSSPLPEDTVAQLKEKLTAYAEDVNADGKIIVQINQYPANSNDKDADAVEYAAASKVRLMGDLESKESCFFILESVETFHKDYDVLADANGTIATKASPVQSYRWADLPWLTNPPLGTYSETILGKGVTGSSDALMKDYSLARRGYLSGTTPKEAEAYERIWNHLTKGESS